MALIDAAVPPLPWRSRPAGFATLVRMVMEQQVSTASAEAIWRRLEAGLGEVTPAAVLARSEEELRGFGLSRQKALYAREIAAAGVDFPALSTIPEAEAEARLTAIKGVGRWTAEVYLLMCEGRMDAFPAGDLALQEAMRAAEGSPLRPSERALRARAEPWRPWRGVAAHLLWAFYRVARRTPASPQA
jgi:DNA-3-methyladenine glycosylase II